MYALITNANRNFFVSEPGFSLFFNWAAGWINNVYPTIPLNGTFQEFAEAVARIQLQENADFQRLTLQQQDAIVSKEASQIMEAFSSVAPQKVTVTSASKPISHVFYTYLAAGASKLQDKFNTFFIGAWVLIVFLVLRGIGIVVAWVDQFVSLIFYEALLAAGFMKIGEQPATKEIVEY